MVNQGNITGFSTSRFELNNKLNEASNCLLLKTIYASRRHSCPDRHTCTLDNIIIFQKVCMKKRKKTRPGDLVMPDPAGWGRKDSD